MREILFRGKRVDNGEWIEGGLVKVGPLFIIFSDTLPGCQTVTYPAIGQFTGMYDKNDKRIFEGDIVKTKYGRLCTVVWFMSQAHNGWDLAVVGTVENSVHTKYPDEFDLYKKENLEVVGNIHDNPELLGESK